MDWSLSANIAAVVIPAGCVLVYVLDMRIKLAVNANNDDLIEKINGKYIRTKEQLKDNANYERRLDDHDERLDKLDLDMRNVTASLARRAANGQ